MVSTKSTLSVWSWSLGLILMIAALPDATECFRIGAFNVQVFGKSKMSKPEVVEVLVKIIHRYDVVLIQEIRDSSGTAIEELLNKVNKQGPNEYQMLVSERLGRTTSKEQYAYFYRLNSGLTILDSYQDEDVKDIFEREPFAVYIQSTRTALSKFALVGVHVAPNHAPKEIDALKIVLDDINKHWGEDNILIMGDLNADCSYFTKAEKEACVLRTPEYHWLITDEADTTVSATDCAYDRFIVESESFVRSIVPESVQVFYFDREYGLTEEEAKAVSDHYPIDLELSEDMKRSASTPPPPAGSSHTASRRGVLGGLIDSVRDFFSKARKQWEL